MKDYLSHMKQRETTRSGIAKHAKQHKIKIIQKEKHWLRRNIKEAAYIR